MTFGGRSFLFLQTVKNLLTERDLGNLRTKGVVFALEMVRKVCAFPHAEKKGEGEATIPWQTWWLGGDEIVYIPKCCGVT
jgi:hypothetical protein